MLECPNCKTKNNERNYYCNWCGAILRENAGKSKKLKEKYDYLFNLPIVEDDSRDIDSFAPYRSKGEGNKGNKGK